jgi:hypothetical protein
VVTLKVARNETPRDAGFLRKRPTRFLPVFHLPCGFFGVRVSLPEESMAPKRQAVIVAPAGISRQAVAKLAVNARETYPDVRAFYSEPALSVLFQMHPKSSSNEVAKQAALAMEDKLFQQHGIVAKLDPEITDWINSMYIAVYRAVLQLQLVFFSGSDTPCRQ